MPKQYRSREGEAAAIDTKSQLTTLGSESAPGALLVPEKARKLVEVWIAAAINYAAAGAASGFIRLEGAGLPKGPETFAAIAAGGNSTTGVQGGSPVHVIKNLDIEVTPGNEILIFGEFVNDDVGQMSFGVTLVFD